jgi:hypothetical protein
MHANALEFLAKRRTTKVHERTVEPVDEVTATDSMGKERRTWQRR